MLLNALDLVTKRPRKKINIFNIASNSFITVNSIADIIENEMEIKPKRHWTGGKIGWKGDVAKVRIDNGKS